MQRSEDHLMVSSLPSVLKDLKIRSVLKQVPVHNVTDTHTPPPPLIMSSVLLLVKMTVCSPG